MSAISRVSAGVKPHLVEEYVQIRGNLDRNNRDQIRLQEEHTRLTESLGDIKSKIVGEFPGKEFVLGDTLVSVDPGPHGHTINIRKATVL